LKVKVSITARASVRALTRERRAFCYAAIFATCNGYQAGSSGVFEGFNPVTQLAPESFYKGRRFPR